MKWPFQHTITDRIGEEPIMIRYYLTPKIFNLRLCIHKFLRSDNDRHYHDHPWNYISLILKGHYVEHFPTPFFSFGNLYRVDCTIHYGPGDILRKKKEHKHWVELINPLTGITKPCWTLILFYGKRRDWGFWVEDKFVPHEEYTL